jgi:hypothetical protein
MPEPVGTTEAAVPYSRGRPPHVPAGEWGVSLMDADYKEFQAPLPQRDPSEDRTFV